MIAIKGENMQLEIINPKLIDNYIKQNKITKKEFAKLCNISSVESLKKIYDGKTNFFLTTFNKIILLLNVAIWELFEEKKI